MALTLSPERLLGASASCWDADRSHGRPPQDRGRPSSENTGNRFNRFEPAAEPCHCVAVLGKFPVWRKSHREVGDTAERRPCKLLPNIIFARIGCSHVPARRGVAWTKIDRQAFQALLGVIRASHGPVQTTCDSDATRTDAGTSDRSTEPDRPRCAVPEGLLDSA